jgi:hypothetical protein
MAPGETGTFGFVIRNDGPVPVTLLGFADEPFIGGVRTVDAGGRIASLGALPAAGDAGPGDRVDLDEAVVPWPIRLDPGRRLLLVPVVRAGPCAQPDEAAADAAALISRVDVVYRIAGWTRVAPVDLPVLVHVPSRTTGCGG